MPAQTSPVAIRLNLNGPRTSLLDLVPSGIVLHDGIAGDHTSEYVRSRKGIKILAQFAASKTGILRSRGN